MGAGTSELSFFLLRSLVTSNRGLNRCCHEAEQADFPSALYTEVLGYFSHDDHANEDDDR